MQPHAENRFPVILISGLSGSGKSSAMDVFEDMGFFTVDGLPIAFAPQMVEMVTNFPMSDYLGIVIGLDLRQDDFLPGYESFLMELQSKGYTPFTIFLEAKPEFLLKRYATTRRPHPLEKEGLGLEQALEAEFLRLSQFREKADAVIDTSGYSIHDLRRAIQSEWNCLLDVRRPLRVHILSFGFKYGAPAEADMMFDMRFLPNPYFISDLRPLSGKDEPVERFVLEEEPGKEYFARLADFLEFTLSQYENEGRFRLTIAIGCTGGRHRSVAVAEALSRRLEKSGYTVSLEHRHLALG